MMRYLILIGLISLCTSAFAQENSPEKVISLRTTACFGTCPVYEFILYKDRTASYNGEIHTEREGLWKAKVTRKSYKKLLRSFRNSDFFNYQDKYTANITDMPTVFLYYNDGEREKEIEDYHGAPKTLNTLENEVMAFIETLNWRKAEE